jgi:NAD-dependent dihydropyrimidine dehydrogenase PreA subunit
MFGLEVFMAAFILPELCVGCGQCALVCPQEAIVILVKVATVIPDKCIDCENCVFSCINGAITII